MFVKNLKVGSTYVYFQRFRQGERQWCEPVYPVYMGDIADTLQEMNHPARYLFAWCIQSDFGNSARVDVLTESDVREAVLPLGVYPDFLTDYPMGER